MLRRWRRSSPLAPWAPSSSGWSRPGSPGSSRPPPPACHSGAAALARGRRRWPSPPASCQPPAQLQLHSLCSKSSTRCTTTVTRPTAGQLLTTVAPSRPNACATFPAPPSERPPVGSRSAGGAGIGRPAAHRPSSPASHFRGRSSLLPEESSRQNLFLALNIHQLVPELIS